MLEIKESVAVITGGGGGIGLAVAKYWVQNGGKVVIADVAEKFLEQAEAEIKALNGDVASVVCNVTREDDCARLADIAIETFGQINLVAPFAGIIKDGLMLSTDRTTGKVNRKMRRLLFGSLILMGLSVTASVMKMPGIPPKIIAIIGLVMAIKGIMLLTSKTSEKLFEWWAARPVSFFRMQGVVILLIGLALVVF